MTSKSTGGFSAKSKIYAALHQDEIAAKTREVFLLAGGTNHFQAKTIALTAKQAVGSKNHKLSTIQPRISDIDTDQWKWGFSMVIAFLKKYKMQNTIDAIMTELQERPFPEYKHVFDPDLTEKYFADLLAVLPNFEARDFDKNVMEFMEDIKYEDALQFSPLVNSSPLSKKRPTKRESAVDSQKDSPAPDELLNFD